MRSAALKELVQIYAVEGVANQGDFGLFLDLLRDEGFFTVRARQLVNLALQAASSGADGGQRGQTLESACDDLLRLLLARFQLDALPAMGKVARKAGRDFVRRLATDDRPALRAVAATELGRALEEGDGALLLAMLNDPAAPVEAAAALALGQAGVEEARTELLLRARLAEPFVRRSALRAVGNLGGEYVLDALVLGVSDPDPNIKLGAAEGLADLQDPRSASLFIALLRQDRDSEIYAAARRGLIRLGPLAREDLLRVARSPAHRARREVALLLGQMCAPEIVPALIDMIEDDATDALVGFELATLTCVDARAALDPAALWAEWYDEVVHDRSLPWFLAALERRGMSAPPGAEYGVGGSPEAALLLLDVLGREEDFLVERARRELGRILDRDLGRLPLGQNARELWLSALREAVLEQFASSRAAEQLK
jgi:HEAT repeat protein